MGVDAIKQVEMKEKKRESQENQKDTKDKTILLETYQSEKYLGCSLIKYSQPFLKLTIDQNTRNIITIHKALHTSDEVDRLYVSRKEGGRKFASVEDSVDGSIQRLEDYIKKTWKKTDHSHQMQYWQLENIQKPNNQETKLGRKTTLWTF